MNIAKAVWGYAMKRGLDWIATGGGCDFICTTDRGENEPMLVLGSAEDAGWSPTSLRDQACVVVYPAAKDWNRGVSLTFPTACMAIDFMASTNVSAFGLEEEVKTGVESGSLVVPRAAIVRAVRSAFNAGKQWAETYVSWFTPTAEDTERRRKAATRNAFKLISKWRAR